MKKIAAVLGTALAFGVVAAPAATADELPPYKCLFSLPVLQKEAPFVLGAVGCEEKKDEKPGKSEDAPGQNKGGEY